MVNVLWDHAAYVAEVRKQLRALDRDSVAESGVQQRTRLTGNAYYTAQFDQCWLQAEVNFESDNPLDLLGSGKFWFALIPSLTPHYDPYGGLVSSMDGSLFQIEEGWYATTSSGGKGN